MALLVPSLHHLRSQDAGITNRFSCMATVALESCGSHPTVAIECMAFFEILVRNQGMLPPPSPSMVHTENPLLSCIPYIGACLKPERPELFFVPSWRGMRGCRSSTRGLRAVMRALKIMLLAQISVQQDDMNFVSALFAFLEATCGSRIFAGATLHRPLAAPRASELTAVEGIALEKEVTDVLRLLLRLEVAPPANDGRALRWILFVRSLVASTPTTNGGMQESFEGSVEGTRRKADAIAARDVAMVLNSVSQVRWQTKSFALQLATGALDEITFSCTQQGQTFSDSPDFNHTAAAKEIQNSRISGSTSLPSRLVFHLSSIITLACTSTVASVDQTELPTLQESGVLFLSKLIGCFQGIPDPEQHDDGILDQYATQIFSSVKHALGEDGMSGEAYYRRFVAGCEAIQTIVRIEMTKDPMVLKRITRPTVPSPEETPYFKYEDVYPRGALKSRESNQCGNRRAALLVHIGKLWTVGKLLSMHGENDAEASTVRQLIDNESNIAVHSAAVAFDGARLLLGSNASLCGYEVSVPSGFEGEDEEKSHFSTQESGFLYDNIRDIDDSVKGCIAKAWAACGCFALRSLVRAVSNESDEEKKKAYSTWIEKLVPLMFSGLDDSIFALSSQQKAKASDWCGGIDSSEVAVYCLYGLRIFVEDALMARRFTKRGSDIEKVLDRLLDTIILPALGQEPKHAQQDEAGKEGGQKTFLLARKDRQTAVVKEACVLLRHVAANTLEVSSSLLMSILTPLDLLQRKVIGFGGSHVEDIISMCLHAARELILLSKAQDSFVKSMAKVALDVHLTGKAIPFKVNQASRLLLEACLAHKAVETKDRRFMAYELAKTGHWETWSVVCTMDQEAAAAASMDVLRAALLDDSKPDKQLETLAVLRKLAQIPDSSLAGFLMNEVGAEVLHFFKTFGTFAAGATLSRAGRSQRTTACTDAMKIVLVSFQQLVSDSVEEQIFVAFLTVVFDYMIIMLRFNGLPNHPLPQTGSDPTLGRMTAQAVLHIARTAPAAFKATMASMSETDRSVLEFAVRAEMTGYATSAQAPGKKKLNLEGFKK